MATTGPAATRFDYMRPMLGLRSVDDQPIEIASVELVRWRDIYFVRARSKDGAEGIATAGPAVRHSGGRWAPLVHPIFNRIVAPYFAGKDARDLEDLVEGVYNFEGNYKIAGPAFWLCVAWVENAVFDLLGKIAGRPVVDLLGGRKRDAVPVYLSSLRRDTTPEQEVEWVGTRLAETNAKAVKLKIGMQMGKNTDPIPGRSEGLIALSRQRFGEDVAIYFDANGGYDLEHAIRMGRLLEEHRINWYEEPIPWEDHEGTREVTAAMSIPVAGGEQDCSLPMFEVMARTNCVDILQPDIAYHGGIVRTMRVGLMADRYGRQMTPHSPYVGAGQAASVHMCAALEHFNLPLEQNALPPAPADWFSPDFAIRNGAVDVPAGPGLGVEYAPEVMRDAEVVVS